MFEAVRAAVGGGTEFTARQWALLAAPFALVASMYVTFQGWSPGWATGRGSACR